MRPFSSPAVAQTFASFPSHIREKMLKLRELIFEIAAITEGVGELEETLKWGEPSYLTSKTGSGTTIRIAWKAVKPDEYAMYFNCQTTLIATFRTIFPHEFNYEGNRAIVFKQAVPIADDALAPCIKAALTYHRCKKLKPRPLN